MEFVEFVTSLSFGIYRQIETKKDFSMKESQRLIHLQTVIGEEGERTNYIPLY